MRRQNYVPVLGNTREKHLAPGMGWEFMEGFQEKKKKKQLSKVLKDE